MISFVLSNKSAIILKPEFFEVFWNIIIIVPASLLQNKIVFYDEAKDYFSPLGTI